jgi:hypothetical protein
MNPKELMEGLRKQKEEMQAVQALWDVLFPDMPKPDSRQCRIWSTDYTFEEIVAGLDKAAKQYNISITGTDERMKPWDREHVLSYASGTMKGLKLDKMTDDQREAHINEVRRKAGMRGARAKHEKEAQKARSARNRKESKDILAKQHLDAVANVCQILPDSLPLTVTVPVSGSGSLSGAGAVALPVSAAQNREGKAPLTPSLEPQPKPEPQTKRSSLAPDGTTWPEWDAHDQTWHTRKLIELGLTKPGVPTSGPRKKKQNRYEVDLSIDGYDLTPLDDFDPANTEWRCSYKHKSQHFGGMALALRAPPCG